MDIALNLRLQRQNRQSIFRDMAPKTPAGRCTLGVSQAFRDRVGDARYRLKRGESLESIRERHGGVVLAEAKRKTEVVIDERD